MSPRKTIHKKVLFLPFLALILLQQYFLGLETATPEPEPIPPKTISTGKKIRFDRTVYGRASWYGRRFHGRLTANGETYDMHTLTAAHKYLPFDTMVKVTNLRNGETVVVRINDRGPYIRGRHIDLSYAAAKHLNMVGTGVSPVKLEIMRNRGRFEYRAPKLAKK